MKKLFYAIAVIVSVGGVACELYLQHLSKQAHTTPAGVVFSEPGKEPEKYGTVPDFSLTNYDGKNVKLADLEGKVWLADFVYTTCPSSCPMISSNFEGLQKDVLAIPGTHMVSFSVDPTHDTPEVLSSYAKRFQAMPGWYFLTGDLDQVSKIARDGFLVGFASLPDGKQITHSEKIALVDKKGNVRHFYDGVSSGDKPKILADIKALIQEAP